MEKLSSDEKDVLAGYLVRAKLGEALGGTGGVPIGTTVGDAIDNQVRWKADQQVKNAEATATTRQHEAEAQALREPIERERSAFQQQFDSALTVTLVNFRQWQAADASAAAPRDHGP